MSPTTVQSSTAATAAEPPPEWLAAWVADQLRSGAGRRMRLSGVEGDAMYVFGSIGVDAVLTAGGDLWVGEYEFDTVEGTAATVTWRRAAGVERLGFLVIASRRFSALRGLLPRRPADGASCSDCRATGDWHLFSSDRKECLRIRGMICKACGGMGWRDGATARVDEGGRWQRGLR